MHAWRRFLFTFFFLWNSGGTFALAAENQASQKRVELILVHANDIYEMNGVGCVPSEGDLVCQTGGVPRLAGLINQIRREAEPRGAFVYGVFAGDLLSPSSLQTIFQPPGSHLVNLLSMGTSSGLPSIQFAVFGNHDFDTGIHNFASTLRLAPRFEWFTENLRFPGKATSAVHNHAGVTCPHSEYCLLRIAFAQGMETNEVTIALVGATVDPGRSWVEYEDADGDGEKTPRDAVAAVRRRIRQVRDKADILVGLTHLAINEDMELATSPEGRQLALIMGGHEHTRTAVTQGCSGKWPAQKPIGVPTEQNRGALYCPRSAAIRTPIFKADSNAASAWVHSITWIPGAVDKEIVVESKLYELAGDLVPVDPVVMDAARRYWDFVKEQIMTWGSTAVSEIGSTTEHFDGTEDCVRMGRCSDRYRLLNRILSSMLLSDEGADFAVMHGGTVRIEDSLFLDADEVSPKTLFYFDWLRLFPFPDHIVTLVMTKGKLLEAIEVAQQKCLGKGCLLWAKPRGGADLTQFTDVEQYFVEIKGKIADFPHPTVRVIGPDYLFSGREDFIGPILKDGIFSLDFGEAPAPLRSIVARYFNQSRKESNGRR